MRKYLDIPLTLIVTTVLTVAMLWPIHQPPPAPEGSDKVVHLIAFAALAFPLARTGRIGLIPVFVGASVFGGLIEVIQPSFGRSADMQDWIAEKRYAQHDVIIIYCDDDRIYKSDWIERLIKAHKNNDGCCVADEMFDIPQFSAQHFMKRTPVYRLKRGLSLGLWNPKKKKMSYAVIAEGFGGVLVKPQFFDNSVFNIPNEFFLVDDIWFSAKLAERKIPIIFSKRRNVDKSVEVLVEGIDIGRDDGSLTTTSFDGNKREDLNLIAMRFAAENLGVWKKWCEYLY